MQEFTEEELNNEEWRVIPYYNGRYLVSNLGRVESVNKYGKRLILTPFVHEYYIYKLYKDGVGITERGHRLVVQAFSGYDRDSDLVVDHIDYNKLNNRLENLQVITNRENNIRSSSNTTNYVGAIAVKRSSGTMYSSKIKINGNNVFLGVYKTPQEANLAYVRAMKNIGDYNGNNHEFKVSLGFYNFKSKYKGVTIDERNGKFRAVICINECNISLGSYDKETDARDAYVLAKNNRDCFNGDKNAFKELIGIPTIDNKNK